MPPQGRFPTQARLRRKFPIHPNYVVDVCANIVLPAIECLLIPLLKVVGKSKHEIGKRIVGKLTAEVENSFPISQTEALLPVLNVLATKRQVVPAHGHVYIICDLIIVLEYLDWGASAATNSKVSTDADTHVIRCRLINIYADIPKAKRVWRRTARNRKPRIPGMDRVNNVWAQGVSLANHYRFVMINNSPEPG